MALSSPAEDVFLIEASHNNLHHLKAFRIGRYANLSAFYPATPEVGNAYLLQLLLNMAFGVSQLEPTQETFQILTVALSSAHHDH